jgi:hypothetical protein
MRLREQRGQESVSMVMLFVFVIAALIALVLYVQRGFAGGLRSNADSFGTQFSSANPWTSTTNSNTTENQTSVNTTQTSNYQQTLP